MMSLFAVIHSEICIINVRIAKLYFRQQRRAYSAVSIFFQQVNFIKIILRLLNLYTFSTNMKEV